MKIKLRDMTFDQYKKWYFKDGRQTCKNCPFHKVRCFAETIDYCWVNNKESYSDKFLDQEIEIEDEPLIDKQTQDYLEKINKDYDVTHVRKGSDYIRFFADIDGEWEINFYCSKKAKIYNDFRNLETGKDYLIKDLIQSKNDILTLQERQYLRAVIKPFRDKVAFISKQETPANIKTKEYICMLLNSKEGTSWEDLFALPYFEVGTMYKGMEVGKRYTLEELGL